MTQDIVNFAARVVADFKIQSGRTLEVGAYNVNGSVRPVFKNATCTEYVGIDMSAGPDVDRVLNAHQIAEAWDPETFDTVICCEMLEHDLTPWVTVAAMKRVLKRGGNLFVSTPTFGFPEHRYPVDCYRYGKDAYEGFIFDDCDIHRLEQVPGPIMCCYGTKRTRAPLGAPAPDGGVAAWVDACVDGLQSNTERAFGRTLDKPTIEKVKGFLTQLVEIGPGVETLDDAFRDARERPSDIFQHVETLASYAARCDEVVELGTRGGISTIAFLYARPKRLTAIDRRHHQPMIDRLKKLSDASTDFVAVEADVLASEIPPCDLLFIDTDHNADQLRRELALHARKVRKWIILHDTVTFGESAGDGRPGLNPALYEFVAANPRWRVERVYSNNHGLTVLANT